ncbi:MAG: glutamine synthetase adenylyltransferase, partial [Nitrospinota bacterium]
MLAIDYTHCRELLPQEQLGTDEVRRLPAPVGFADWRAADRCLQRIADDPHVRQAFAECLPEVLLALTEAANPDRALVNFERFAHNVANRIGLFRYLASDPRMVEILITLFAGSQFLTEILLRNPEYFELLRDRRQLARPKSDEQFAAEVEAGIAPFQRAENQLNALRRLQRRELLCIGTCDLLGLWDLPTVMTQLSSLAEHLVRACLQIASVQSRTLPEGFVVIALGKLGGRELNYSSDIDLLFLAASEAPAYKRLGEELIGALARMTAEGFLYRVDMRLRPWGRLGPLVSSLDTYVAYLQKHARLWEKQALLKARPVAGDEHVGAEFQRRIEPFLFADTPDASIRNDVRAMKQRIEAQLRRQGRARGEVKLGEGSIRDVEFVTQYLQLLHGARYPEIRSGNTLDALARLTASGLLPANDYLVLSDGYLFLRTVEHHLQMMHYQQTHRLPDTAEELSALGKRLGFQGVEAGTRFLTRYQQHSAAIRAIYQRYLEDESPPSSPPAPSSPLLQGDLARHVQRMDASYLETFTPQEIAQHAAMAEQLDEERLAVVEAEPLEQGNWRVTIVGYDYLGELSLICGLLFVYGFNILDGQVFTYEPLPRSPSPTSRFRTRSRRSSREQEETRQKIVDVFTVHPVQGRVSLELWAQYADDLLRLLRRLHVGQQREVQGELAKRAARALEKMRPHPEVLYPVEIDIDNTASDRYTVLRIDAPDTVGFLYELTNALALDEIYIARVAVTSVGSRVHDTLYVTDAHGRKITTPERQRALRAAVVLVKHFTHLLPRSPNPESALLHFRELLGQLFSRPDWPDALASLDRPEVLDALARLLGVSDFLWDDFLRMQYTNLFPVVRDVETLTLSKSKERLRTELESTLEQAGDEEARRRALNAFKDREMFRIDMRHIQGYIPSFEQFSQELTDLAEVVVEAAYRLCAAELQVRFGTPCLEDGTPCPMSICALGKCGGGELGFASDIELMFLYAGNGKTTGPEVITTAA